MTRSVLLSLVLNAFCKGHGDNQPCPRLTCELGPIWQPTMPKTPHFISEAVLPK